MNRKWLIALGAGVGIAAVVLVAVVAARPVDDPGTAEVPTSIEYVTFAGAEQMLGTYRGQPLVVNFFASWCGPCRAELPDFAEAHSRFGDQVAFLGIDFQETSVPAAAQLLFDTGITYDITEDPVGEIYQALGGIGAMPTTIFIDASGEVVARRHGIIFAEELFAQVEALTAGG